MIPAMAWSTTADGMLDFANQHFLDYVGLPLSDIAGENFYRLFHPKTSNDWALSGGTL